MGYSGGGWGGGGGGWCGGLTGKRLCGSMISIELHRNSVGITLPHGCSPVGLLRPWTTASE